MSESTSNLQQEDVTGQSDEQTMSSASNINNLKVTIYYIIYLTNVARVGVVLKLTTIKLTTPIIVSFIR